MVVTLGWLIVAAFGALPYYFYARLPVPAESPAKCHIAPSEEAPVGSEFCSFTNAFFESMSGFTTTGSSIIARGLWSHPERNPDTDLPHGLLLWRSMTQWLGGMGIVVLAVAILPLLGIGGMQLFRAESPGPTTERLMPRMRETAKQLWKVYALLTTIQIGLLMVSGLDWYMALTHSFSTMATGGFSPLAESAAGLGNPTAEVIITVFMFLAGANFYLHYSTIFVRRVPHFQDAEFRLYIWVTLAAIILVATPLWLSGRLDALVSLRVAAFQVVSILTTTGFSSVDFDQWRYFAPLSAFVLFFLLFVGGSAGSTSGGVKCIRHWVMFKEALRSIQKLIHPRAIMHVKLGGKKVDESTIHAIIGFVTLYFMAFTIAVLCLAVSGLDLLSASSGAISSLSNVGPGFGTLGPAANFGHLPDSAKWLMAFLMLLGRLEVYTVVVLLFPSFWRD